MNDVMRGKIEACLELSEGREYKFKKDVMKVTGLTDGGFHLLNITDVAYAMLRRGEKLETVINTVL
jgi:hypothetical protein